MDHAEARELLDLAALEVGGLDRLMAGDTASSMAVAGHLAGCDDCMDEYGRLRRASAVLRDVLVTQPPADLRATTLAFIAAVGRPRGPAAGTASEPVAEVPESRVAATGPLPAAAAAPIRLPVNARRDMRRRLAWFAAAAALVIVSAGATGYAVTSSADAFARQRSLELAGLAQVASWTVRLDAQADVRHVPLAMAAGAGDGPAGVLVFSPGARELVVVAKGLAVPDAGREYGCWVEVGGARQRLGRMYFSGDIAYWVGKADVLATVPAGAIFGVSLTDGASPGGSSPTILSGTLKAT